MTDVPISQRVVAERVSVEDTDLIDQVLDVLTRDKMNRSIEERLAATERSAALVDLLVGALIEVYFSQRTKRSSVAPDVRPTRRSLANESTAEERAVEGLRMRRAQLLNYGR